MGLGTQSYCYPIGTQATNGRVGCPVALSPQSYWTGAYLFLTKNNFFLINIIFSFIDIVHTVKNSNVLSHIYVHILSFYTSKLSV
jgi:hypothetical protein